MIGMLTGKPLITPRSFMMLCGGVGYAVQVGSTVIGKANGQSELTLFVYTHVREEALELYGFLTEEEKDLFLLLLAVSGVGPKTALAIANAGAEKISTAVQNAEVTFFTKIPRVGKKLAQKIIIDLKSKLGGLKELQLGSFDDHTQVIVDAIVSLGFEEELVGETVRSMDLTDKNEATAIKEVLQKLKQR